MATLRDVLMRRYGYGRDDFGSAGLVRLDCVEATLSPVPMRDIFTPHSIEPAKVVRLADLFAAGQTVTLTGIGRSPTLRLIVRAVESGGLAVETEAGIREFLPWDRLRHALMRPELLIFHTNSDLAGKMRGGEKKGAKSLCASPRLAL